MDHWSFPIILWFSLLLSISSFYPCCAVGRWLKHALRGLFKATSACYILCNSDIVNSIPKKHFKGGSFQSIYESIFKSVQCFSHVWAVNTLYICNLQAKINKTNRIKKTGSGLVKLVSNTTSVLAELWWSAMMV